MLPEHLLYSIPPFLTAALLAGLAFIALGPGRRAPGSRYLVALCLLGSLLYADIIVNFNASAGTALAVSCIAHLFYPLLLPLFIKFFHAFLGVRHRAALETFALGYALLICACSAAGWVLQGNRLFAFGYFGQAGPLFLLLAAGAALATIYNGVIIYQAIRKEERSVHKNKLKYVFFGFGLLGALSTLNCLTVFGWPLYPPGNFGFIPLLVFAAGVFRYDLLDMGALLRKCFLYAVLTGVLALSYLLLIIPFQQLFRILGWVESPFLPIGPLFLILFGYPRLKKQVQSAVERWLIKERFDFRRTLRHVSQKIAMLQDYAHIADLLREIIIEAMKAKSCALFLVGAADGYCRAVATAGTTSIMPGFSLGPDTAVALYLRQDRSNRPLRKQQLMGAATGGRRDALVKELERIACDILLPMRFQQELKGFLVLGEKCSGDVYDSEDLDLLEPLCHQSAIAIQNADAYQALRELNRSLEQKVAERTRALQEALAEKERSQEQLIRTESLAAIGQLVAGVAHELNNPLASVTSLLQSAVEEMQMGAAAQVPGQADILEDLQFADKELARAKRIVASLLGLSRQTQTYEEPVDLNAVVHDSMQLLQKMFKRRSLHLSTNLEKDLPSIKGNFALLGQVVLNIVQNALQAVDDEKGRILLATSCRPDREYVEFICQDNGPGIDPSLQRDVFKPFFTTKPVGQGTGLGLYICHRIVEKHAGSIQLTSAVPHGSILTVALPRAR